MKTFIITEWSTVKKEYSLNLDDEYCKSLTNYIKENVTNPDDVPELTPQVIYDYMYGEYDEDIDLIIQSEFIGPHKVSLSALIEDYLLDDAYSTDPEYDDEWTDESDWDIIDY